MTGEGFCDPSFEPRDVRLLRPKARHDHLNVQDGRSDDRTIRGERTRDLDMADALLDCLGPPHIVAAIKTPQRRGSRLLRLHQFGVT